MTAYRRRLLLGLAHLRLAEFELIPLEDGESATIAATRVRSFLSVIKPLWCWRWRVRATTRSGLAVTKIGLRPLAAPWTCKLHNHPFALPNR